MNVSVTRQDALQIPHGRAFMPSRGSVTVHGIPCSLHVRTKQAALPKVAGDLIDLDYHSPVPEYPDFEGPAQPGSSFRDVPRLQ